MSKEKKLLYSVLLDIMYIRYRKRSINLIVLLLFSYTLGGMHLVHSATVLLVAHQGTWLVTRRLPIQASLLPSCHHLWTRLLKSSAVIIVKPSLWLSILDVSGRGRSAKTIVVASPMRVGNVYFCIFQQNKQSCCWSGIFTGVSMTAWNYINR